MILEPSIITEQDIIAYKVVNIDSCCGSVNGYYSEWSAQYRTPQLLDNNDEWLNTNKAKNIRFNEDECCLSLVNRGNCVEYVIGADMTDNVGVGYYLYVHHQTARARCFSGFEVLRVRIPAGTQVRFGVVSNRKAVLSPHIIVEKVLGSKRV